MHVVITTFHEKDAEGENNNMQFASLLKLLHEIYIFTIGGHEKSWESHEKVCSPLSSCNNKPENKQPHKQQTI